MKLRNLKQKIRRRLQTGFSLIECVFAMVILMIGALAIVSVLAFSVKSNADSKKRYFATLLAQRRLEDVRNTPFTSLTAGTVTETNVAEDGVQYDITRVITDNDLVLDNTNAPGAETKKIVVT